MKIGIIRVITSDDQHFLDGHGRILADYFGLESVTRCIPDQPNGIHSDETEAMAIPKIVALAQQMAADDDIDILYISCAADPGLAECRAVLDIPVIGAGSAGAGFALATADKVGVLGITGDVPAAVKDALGDRMVADIVPDGVGSTVDLMKPEGYEAALRAGDELVAAGAQCILFACTGLTTIGLRPELAARVGVPVVDAVLAAGAVLQNIAIFNTAADPAADNTKEGATR